MKATKKIVGAACALVAAVALSAGSTFAWFQTSSHVTATGMKVQATVPTSLYIADGYKTAASDVNETVIDYKDANATSLSPAAIATEIGTGTNNDNGTADDTTDDYMEYAAADVKLGEAVVTADLNVVYATKYSTDPGSGVVGVPTHYASAGTVTLPDSTIAAGTNAYLYAKEMTLANKGQAIDVTATVTVTWDDTADQTHEFLRTGFLVSVPGTPSNTVNYVSLENEVAEGKVKVDGQSLEFTYKDLVKTFANNTVVNITFMVWFDGNDKDCEINKAATIDEFAISIAYDVPQPQNGG